MELTKLFKAFSDSKKAGGLILAGCTAVSLLCADSSFQGDYLLKNY